jgi:UDP-GlcNAc:undecaprenyl-phosphate GlcNAc-1-phosphate transferase
MLIFVTALFFGSVGTPVAKNVAIKMGFIALPKADRAHTEPTALMGGLAIYAAAIGALFIIIVITNFILGNPFRLQELLAIMMGASLMAAIGLWDDGGPYRPGPSWDFSYFRPPLYLQPGSECIYLCFKLAV